MATLATARSVFRAVAVTVVPEAATLDAAAWRDLEAIVEQAIAQRPPPLQRQLGALLRAIELLSLARYGRRFTALDPVRRARFLHALEHAPVVLLRRGFWGLRTLALMGYYARPAAAGGIGYRADPRGWDARR